MAAGLRLRLASRPSGRPHWPTGGGTVRMSSFSGDQVAQVSNPDPFAVPVWRSPVLHTPGWIIAVVQIARTLGRCCGSWPATPSLTW